jgi:hypothetical protein
MANLIITVISIALVAVAAVMGAYYGGSAFMEGQKKAQVNALISSAEQISAAWTMKVIANGGNWGLPDYDYNLVPTFLSSLPKNPDFTDNQWVKTTPTSYPNSGIDYNDPNPYYLLALFIYSTDKGLEACKLISKIAGGDNALPTNGAITDSWSLPSGRKFDCIFSPKDENGYTYDTNKTSPTVEDEMFLIYRMS